MIRKLVAISLFSVIVLVGCTSGSVEVNKEVCYKVVAHKFYQDYLFGVFPLKNVYEYVVLQDGREIDIWKFALNNNALGQYCEYIVIVEK